jgi:hypothetical protein
MENIQIIDDFFDESILHEIIDKINKEAYIFNCTNNHNFNLNTDIPFWKSKLNNDRIYFNDYLPNIINSKLQQNYKLKRVYLIGQTYQQNSNYHEDSNISTSITICLYLNNNYTDNDGYLYIKIPGQKTIMTIEPKMNRIVVFPAIYRHRGNGLNDDELRNCLAFKFYNNSNYTE